MTGEREMSQDAVWISRATVQMEDCSRSGRRILILFLLFLLGRLLPKKPKGSVLLNWIWMKFGGNIRQLYTHFRFDASGVPDCRHNVISRRKVLPPVSVRRLCGRARQFLIYSTCFHDVLHYKHYTISGGSFKLKNHLGRYI